MKRLRPLCGDVTDPPPAKTLRTTNSPSTSPSPDEALQSILTTNSTLDSIDKLPDEILPLVLGKVIMTKDLVRSSVVSRRWREIAVSTILCRPRLVLDGKSLFGSKCCGCRVKRKRSVERKEKFVIAVNQYLPFFCKQYLHYNKPTIVSSLVVEFCLGPSFSDDIVRWIDCVVQVLGVWDICLDLRCRVAAKQIRKNDWPVQKNYNKCVIRSYNRVFSCNVRNLRLGACRFESNLFSLERLEFTRSLKMLQLSNVPLAKYDLESMFGSLVKVETLHFHHCSLPKTLHFRSLPTLRCLILRRCAHIEVIEMFNNLELTKLYCDMHSAIWWDLTGAPNLEKLELRALIDERGINPLFADGPITIPTLTHLSMIITPGAGGLNCIPDGIPVWDSITTLLLVLRTSKPFDAAKMVSLIRVLPSLRKFILQLDFKDLLETENVQIADYSILCLEDVELRASHVTTNLLQFAVYLANHAGNLRRLVFTKAPCSPPLEESVIEKLSELQKLFLEKCVVFHLVYE